jgi:hypothetical protein
VPRAVAVSSDSNRSFLLIDTGTGTGDGDGTEHRRDNETRDGGDDDDSGVICCFVTCPHASLAVAGTHLGRTGLRCAIYVYAICPLAKDYHIQPAMQIPPGILLGFPLLPEDQGISYGHVFACP